MSALGGNCTVNFCGALTVQWAGALTSPTSRVLPLFPVKSVENYRFIIGKRKAPNRGRHIAAAVLDETRPGGWVVCDPTEGSKTVAERWIPLRE